MGRNCPWWVLVLGVCLPLAGMAGTDMPAQDGLKFLRVARLFQAQPWSDVVRSADQHPLYPYLISGVEPVVSLMLGEGPSAWTRSAQVVSLVGALLALTAVYRLGWLLFDRTTGVLAALLWQAAPGAVAISRETLSDSLALGFFGWALCLAVEHWRTGSARAVVGMGVLAGLGYWTRPEAIVLPAAFGGLVAVRYLSEHIRELNLAAWRDGAVALARPAAGLLAFCFLVGSYAMVKGELSEKLALRRGVSIASVHDTPRMAGHALPVGLDDPRWDFSPKEEAEPARPLSAPAALASMANRWAGSLGWVLAAAAIGGAIRVRAGAGRGVVAAYVGLFTLVLLRHAMGLGYLSDRHLLTLSLVSVPWSAAGLLRVGHRLRASASGRAQDGAGSGCWLSRLLH